MPEGSGRGGLLGRAAPALGAVALLAALHLMMAERLPGHLLAAGISNNELSALMSRALAYYLLFGLAAVLLLAWGALRLAPRGAERLLEQLGKDGEGAFVAAASLCAFALALLVHQVLLQRMPLTDDENAYRVAAEILARGHLYLPSDPDRHFFYHNLVVNDGKLYTQYFLGWPALLAPAVAAGVAGLANPFFFAATVPAIFLILRRLAGKAWARLGVLLLLVSPMLTITAGTLLSHTSCMAALAYFVYCGLRCREPDCGWGWHAALAATFCVAFFNRPLTAAGLGLPILLAWLFDLRARPSRWRDLAAFALPAIGAATLFLYVDQTLTGSALRSPYQAYFSFLSQGAPSPEMPEVAFRSLGYSVAIELSAFFRLNFAAFAWPCSWLFVLLAGRGNYRGVLLATIPSFFAANFFTNAIGIDLYAPMHFIEIGLPMVLLTALGIERTQRWGARLDAALAATGGRDRGLAGLPLLVAAASVAVAFGFLMPYQAATVFRAAQLERISRAGLDELPRPALVFVKQPYSLPDCLGSRPSHWVRQAPITPAALDPEVLWAAHIDLPMDRAFAARRFPERHAFVLSWKPGSCERRWTPLAEAREADLPPDDVGIYR